MASSKMDLQIGARLLDPVLRVPLRQIVHMRLQHESVDRFKRVLSELADQVELDLRHLLLRRLWPPVSLSKRKIAVANKPFEGVGAVLEDPALRDSGLSVWLTSSSQRFTRLGAWSSLILRPS